MIDKSAYQPTVRFKEQKHMSFKQFAFEVRVPPGEISQSFMATVRVPLPKNKEDGTASEVLTYLRSIQVKNDFLNGWVRANAAGYGMEIKGGPRPVYTVDNDRTSEVIAYEQDFKLTKSV